MAIVEPKFWMVWCPTRSSPTHQHSSRASADAEAQRLAGLHPGFAFFVLKTVGGSYAEAPEPGDILLRPREPDDDLPF